MTKLLTIFSDITQLIKDENTTTIDDNLLIKFEKNIQSHDIDYTIKRKRGPKQKYTDDERKELNIIKTLAYYNEKKNDPMFLENKRLYMREHRYKNTSLMF
jgi:dTDP-D-glucose 4,6-dehydratase